MTTWHAPADVLARFAESPEALDDVTASSVEQHVITCAECRAAVANSFPRAQLAASWNAVADRVDRPRPTAAEHGLHRLGLPESFTRLVGATVALRVAWFTAVVALAVASVLTARGNDSNSAFLTLSPLLPLAAVVVTFLPGADPAGEAGWAAPLHGVGLAMRRVIGVVLPTFVILAAASLALPDVAGGGVAWLLPGLALATGTLAMSTFTRPAVAASTLAAGWFAVLITVRALDERTIPIGDTAVFAARGQLIAFAVALVALGVVYVRRNEFATLEVDW